MTDPAVGASTCASGSQVCSGNSGTLIANDRKNARNSSICACELEHQTSGLQLAQNLRVVEGAGLVVEIDDRAEHQHRSGHGVQEKLDGRVDAPIVAPDADQEVHRDQRNFPERVEQEQVERDEYTDQSEFEQDQEREKFLHAMVDVFPGNQDRDRREQRGQQHQPQAQAVQSRRDNGSADSGSRERWSKRCSPSVPRTSTARSVRARPRRSPGK